MSGGHWDYIQYRLNDIVDDIKSEIDRNGRPKTKEELKEEYWRDEDWYNKYPEDLNYYKYPEEVIAEFKIAIEVISKAEKYIHRIDWLLSGDDSEETFLEKIK